MTTMKTILFITLAIVLLVVIVSAKKTNLNVEGKGMTTVNTEKKSTKQRSLSELDNLVVPNNQEEVFDDGNGSGGSGAGSDDKKKPKPANGLEMYESLKNVEYKGDEKQAVEHFEVHVEPDVVQEKKNALKETRRYKL
jgi:hypothetical protein